LSKVFLLQQSAWGAGELARRAPSREGPGNL
jgi:hypothetical protein